MRSDQIQQQTRARLEDELQKVYTQRPIEDPAQFSGRSELLAFCRKRLRTNGMSFVVYGERGLGKTSFVNVLLADAKRIRRTAEEGMAFDRLLGPVLSDIGEGWILTERRSTDKATLKGTVKAPGAGISSEVSTELGASYAPVSRTVVELDVVADALLRHSDDYDTVVIEEFHRLLPDAQRDVVQLMKAIADRGGTVRIVVVGTRKLGEELMQDREYKDYIGRSITPVPVTPMTSTELRDIIEKRASEGVRIADDVAADLVWAASGYPGLIHRLMHDAAVDWLDENTARMVSSVLGTVGSHLLGPIGSAAGALVLPILMRRVKLRKAGVTVARPELEGALRRQISEFEREELRGARITDPPTRKLLEAYALSDDEAFDVNAMAERAGLTPRAARQSWDVYGATLQTDQGGRLLPGLRPYLRAQIVLAGQRAGRKHDDDNAAATGPGQARR